MLSNETIIRSLKDHSHTDKSIIIEDLIQKHGAVAVFKATFKWEGGDYAPLEAMGFAPTLEDADKVPYVPYIAYIAHHRMSEDAKSDYWEDSIDLHRRQA
jgi:hypothetical protein